MPELEQHVDGAVGRRRVEPGRRDPLTAHRLAQAVDRVDVDAGDRVGVLLGDLFDLDATLRRQHPEVELGGAVQRERRVVLLRDVARLLDPEDVDDVALDVEAEDGFGVRAAFIGVRGELDAAGLAAPADLHLRFDDDRVADLVGGRDRGVDRLHCLARRHGDAVAREQLLALILVEVQLFRSWPSARPRSSCASSDGSSAHSQLRRG